MISGCIQCFVRFSSVPARNDRCFLPVTLSSFPETGTMLQQHKRLGSYIYTLFGVTLINKLLEKCHSHTEFLFSYIRETEGMWAMCRVSANTYN